MDIGDHGLSCPGPEEYAALALHMQCSALAIDALLTEQQAALNLINDRPLITLIPSVDREVPVPPVPVTNLYDTVEFNNAAFFTLATGLTVNGFGSGTGVNIGSPLGASTVVPYLPGWYEFGVYAEGVDGTPLLGLEETAILYIINKDGTQTAVLTYDSQDSVGTARICFSKTFELTGVDGVTVTVHLDSGVNWNTASSLWVRYLGPSELVEVA